MEVGGGLTLPSAGYDSNPATQDAVGHLKGQAHQSRGNCSPYTGKVWQQWATGVAERARERVATDSRYGNQLISAACCDSAQYHKYVMMGTGVNGDEDDGHVRRWQVGTVATGDGGGGRLWRQWTVGGNRCCAADNNYSKKQR